jgi:hypothetical protein
MTLAFPFFRNRTPHVLYSHIVPTWPERGSETKRDSGKDCNWQHGEPIHQSIPVQVGAYKTQWPERETRTVIEDRMKPEPQRRLI